MLATTIVVIVAMVTMKVKMGAAIHLFLDMVASKFDCLMMLRPCDTPLSEK